MEREKETTRPKSGKKGGPTKERNLLNSQQPKKAKTEVGHGKKRKKKTPAGGGDLGGPARQDPKRKRRGNPQEPAKNFKGTKKAKRQKHKNEWKNRKKPKKLGELLPS